MYFDLSPVSRRKITTFYLPLTDHQFLIKNHLPFGSVSSHRCTYSICIKIIQFSNRIQKKRRAKPISKSTNTTKIIATLVSTNSKWLECNSVQLIHMPLICKQVFCRLHSTSLININCSIYHEAKIDNYIHIHYPIYYKFHSLSWVIFWDNPWKLNTITKMYCTPPQAVLKSVK